MSDTPTENIKDVNPSPAAAGERLQDDRHIALRKEKLAALRQAGCAYPNDFKRRHLAAELVKAWDGLDKAALEQEAPQTAVAGRVMTRRIMGKAAFIHLQDMSGQIQIYVRDNDLPAGVYDAFKQWDLGDIVGVEGTVFKTGRGELSVHAHKIRLLTKALRPLPDKFHGLADQELRYRRRYLDLIANEETRRVFQIRSRLTAALRDYLTGLGYVEAETPMMHVMPGGAAAKPFKTHHNALDMPLYLRISPELYLKRLVVGGFEKVFEINRSFRNEGLSTRHNPEFTMLEFYCAYADYGDMMALTEKMLASLAQTVLGTTTVTCEGESLDLAKPFVRMTVKEAILHHAPHLDAATLADETRAKAAAEKAGIVLHATDELGKIQMKLFEKFAEDRLAEPTFITGFPTEVSPLSRQNDDDPFYVDRFELFIGGREIANGFSELNDPQEQARRFGQQLRHKAAGDEEAMSYDADYIAALEYGLPPTAGEGIGIDRLAMLFTGSAAIRDVLLFPHLRQGWVHSDHFDKDADTAHDV